MKRGEVNPVDLCSPLRAYTRNRYLGVLALDADELLAIVSFDNANVRLVNATSEKLVSG